MRRLSRTGIAIVALVAASCGGGGEEAGDSTTTSSVLDVSSTSEAATTVTEAATTAAAPETTLAGETTTAPVETTTSVVGTTVPASPTVSELLFEGCLSDGSQYRELRPLVSGTPADQALTDAIEVVLKRIIGPDIAPVAGDPSNCDPSSDIEQHVSVKFETIAATPNLLGLVFETEFAGASASISYETLTALPPTGQVVEPAAFFVPGSAWPERVTAEVCARAPDPSLFSEGCEPTVFGALARPRITTDGTNLRVYFDECELFFCAAGPLVTTIERAALADVLAPGGPLPPG
jgi:hypothetical protein